MTGSGSDIVRAGRSAPARRLLWAAAAGLLLAAAAPAAAAADVFNGRIAFASVRSDPQATSFDIFSMNPDGSGVRRLTTNSEGDRQPDWSPRGTAIAYTIDKPGATKNFEVARMTANGTGHRRLTTTQTDEASSQPSWRPDGRALLFRRSGPTSRFGSIWQMGTRGEAPELRVQTAAPPLYPSYAPDMGSVLYTAILSPTGDSDRAILSHSFDGATTTTLFDVAGAYDSAPAWSPDGARIAFESDADVGGANPERDMEIWVMNADGSGPVQLTRNVGIRDEGPSWSPDGALLAFSSGPDDAHLDIHVMTSAGKHVRRLTRFWGADESPDWQTIPAPRTDARCGDIATSGRGAYDVRRAGRGLSCGQARALVRRWVRARQPRRVRGYRVTAKQFGATKRVQLRAGSSKRRRLVAFLYQRAG